MADTVGVDLKPRSDGAQIERHGPTVACGAVGAAHNSATAGVSVLVESDDVGRVRRRDLRYRGRRNQQNRGQETPESNHFPYPYATARLLEVAMKWHFLDALGQCPRGL